MLPAGGVGNLITAPLFKPARFLHSYQETVDGVAEDGELADVVRAAGDALGLD